MAARSYERKKMWGMRPASRNVSRSALHGIEGKLRPERGSTSGKVTGLAGERGLRGRMGAAARFYSGSRRLELGSSSSRSPETAPLSSAW